MLSSISLYMYYKDYQVIKAERSVKGSPGDSSIYKRNEWKDAFLGGIL